MIGAHGFFSGPESTGHGSALVNAGATITDSLLLNKAAGMLDLTHGAVTAFLKECIEWRLVKADGTVLDEDDVPGFGGDNHDRGGAGPGLPLPDAQLGCIQAIDRNYQRQEGWARLDQMTCHLVSQSGDSGSDEVHE